MGSELVAKKYKKSHKKCRLVIEQAIVFFCIILLPAAAAAAQVTLAWDANSEADLAGYKVYYNHSSEGPPYEGTGAAEGDSPINVPLASLTDPDNPEFTLHGVSDTEPCYIVVTAYDVDGNESGYSNQVVYQPEPSSPPESNLPPATPVVSSPYDGEVDYELHSHITMEPYSDPDNDYHSKTRWQMSTSPDFSDLVLDVSSDNHLTDLEIPHALLQAGTTYYVRTKFFDIYSTPSSWSEPVEFTTTTEDNDLNGNGIPDDQEVGDDVDMNRDGEFDNNQPNVIKCAQTTDGKIMCVSPTSTSIAAIEWLQVLDPDTILDNRNRPKDLASGLICYRLRLAQPGDTATVKIYFSRDMSDAEAYYKYDTIKGWRDYSEHTTFNEDGRSVTLELEDGGFGDSDGVANGIIVDPGALATESSDEADSKDSTDLRCFIATAAFGSYLEPQVDLLRQFRDHYLLTNAPGRWFVRNYYHYGPYAARFITEHAWLKPLVRILLLPLVTVSYLLCKMSLAVRLLCVALLLMLCLSFLAVRRRYSG